MSKFPNDDLFEGSKMTFGEHLEELRNALWKAVLGLAVGVIIGFVIGDQVVKFIQTPLVAAMEKYLLARAVDDVAKRLLAEGIVATDPHPESKLPKELHNFIHKHRVQPRRVLVDVQEVLKVAEFVEERQKNGRPASNPVGPETERPAVTPPVPNPVDGVSAPSAVPAPGTPVAPSIPTPASADPATPAVVPEHDFITIHTWEPIKVKISAMNATEAFMIYVQAAIVAGLVFSSPWVIYQIWNFVAEGLYPHEKNYVYVFLPISLSLFLAGAALAFFFVFEPVLTFLFMYNKALEVDPDPRISEWIGFVLMLPIGFGLSFQLPLVMLFIERIGIISAETYLSHWRVAILVICVLSAVLTPADPISMLMMAVPLVFLYFGGIGLCWWIPIGRKPFEEAYEV
jgi:sec-independent protein translocase protein TatC